MSFYQKYKQLYDDMISEGIFELGNEEEIEDLYFLLKEQKITSVKHLHQIIDTLHFKQRRMIAWTLGQMYLPKSVNLMIDLLQDSNPEVRLEASKSLANFGGNKALRATIKILRSTNNPEIRQLAAYTLSFMGEIGAIVPLISVLENSHESPAIRGQAAEGIGYLLSTPQPHPEHLFKRAHKVLLESLSEAAVEVRFWSIFALGCLKSHLALPRLKELAQIDREICPGFWSIQKEAEDAISSIESDDIHVV